jgi:crossover junction endodeoxyribonuclease RuvC
MRILGLDPGFNRTGFGVVEVEGTELRHVWHGLCETPPGQPFSERVIVLRDAVRSSLERFHPEVACVEALFFQRNVKTALTVGMARGVILLTVAESGVHLVELTPSQVKQGIAGWGGADKQQMQQMVMRLLKLAEPPQTDDVADALALAICGGFVAHYQARVVEAIAQSVTKYAPENE